MQERNISGSFPFRQCFNGDAEDRKEKSLTKATQRRRGIIAGSAGIVLLVGSIVSCILKMHIIAVVGGIVGLACIGFALYSTLEPDTKLEKFEDPAQPVIVHSHLNSK
ncbi:hypothetical protein [Wolbachia endosymbiont (group A) of Cheilosia soror]|uniref:hypothetical protein n=1 Tax=Wolbachia endosymbiont (group A) of Cheilosia soror TaxID=2953995 RepID=UPI0021F8D44D|nr:hypothetical protein [Wolbachia endosymbiont (group A) of Cheilosia soror]